MASDQAALRCVGCERAAPASARPEPCGNWLCRSCRAEMQWAMAWMTAIMSPLGGPLVVLGDET